MPPPFCHGAGVPPLLTYSLLGLCAAAILASIWLQQRPASSRLAPLKRWTLGVQIGALVAAYFVLRPGRGDDGAAALALAAGEGRPVLLDFYSNY